MKSDAPAPGPATVRGGTVLGSGLSLFGYFGVLAASVALFLLYGGPLWSAPPPHLARFAVSYSTVLPFAAALLLVTKSFSWPRLTTAVGTIWAIKLLITAPLYYALAPGGALDDIGAFPTARASEVRVPTSAALKPPSGYEPAPGRLESGVIRGQIKSATRDQAVPTGVVVVVDSPPPGKPLGDEQNIIVTLTSRGFDAPMYLMTTVDTLSIHNSGNHLHTARVSAEGQTRLNAPVPPGSKTNTLEMEQPGQLLLTCGTHKGENAAMVVVDHPYAAVATNAGTFELRGVPVGALVVVAIDVMGGALRRTERRVVVRAGEVTDLVIALSEP